MNQFKGTKGYWTISGGNQIVSMPSQCKIINNISGWNYDESVANAQLISAAPELLEALQKVFEHAKLFINENHPDYKLAEKAIKKAIG